MMADHVISKLNTILAVTLQICSADLVLVLLQVHSIALLFLLLVLPLFSMLLLHILKNNLST